MNQKSFRVIGCVVRMAKWVSGALWSASATRLGWPGFERRELLANVEHHQRMLRRAGSVLTQWAEESDGLAGEVALQCRAAARFRALAKEIDAHLPLIWDAEQSFARRSAGGGSWMSRTTGPR